MIKDVTMYSVICDNCGADSNDGTGYYCWNDKSYAEDVAKEAGFEKQDDNHYCEDCYYYDDNDDFKLVIRATFGGYTMLPKVSENIRLNNQ